MRLASCSALVAICAIATFIGESWPRIRPIEAEYQFSDATTAALDLTIRDVKGRPAYDLRCHTWGYEGDPGFDYSGVFECRLVSRYSREKVSTLLTENPKQFADWESRGRFLLEHLVGPCGNVPDWGRSRSFRLRGMVLHLEIERPALALDTAARSGTLKTFQFSVKVESDPEIASAIAMHSEIAEPEWFYHPAACWDFASSKAN